ncbi:hypothetical protein [Natrinema caseinilyticum]|uniref:hypothetical protein n=1 Tax=Natrinema caseinilyticum TaxID=2961570 RepID=UPI0020C537F4|nr:hypothetical protein [Natrinema caseinilyticum]
MSVLAFTRRNADQINATLPVAGATGSIGFFFLMLYHLYVEQRGTFFAVILIAAAIFLVELLYFERRLIEEEIPYITPGVEKSAD